MSTKRKQLLEEFSARAEDYLRAVLFPKRWDVETAKEALAAVAVTIHMFEKGYRAGSRKETP